ncbi:AAA domain-containing protein [Anaerocolumna jejuensis DSM 15929]|uniref:AAA domain-containing protein n=1 Tax=Anaerocolumna jejuensis DSM 15929 TaxID=1121322 RepID=A0A1M6V8K4_9FIRM|nr:ATP-binding protein [Anaerocolumna jejuensis]SHK77684.1 AAA domain-containing protein [Anaerocolumna jejuensis DSM 15929]
MQAQDIIWGGNNKCEIKILRDIGTSAGDVIEITYNYMSDSYEAKKDGNSSAIIVSEASRRTLDNIYLDGSSSATIVRVIDCDDLKLIVEIKVFQDIINFNAMQGIEIEVGEEVIAKMRVKDKENPIGYLSDAFKYNDMLFVKGYGRKGANFTLLSKDRVLNVTRVDNVYVASNLVRYDRNKADFENLYILKGHISFVNATQGASISREVTERMTKIVSGGAYFDIWDAYNDLERLFVLKQATENGVMEYTSYECTLTDCFEYRFHLKSSFEEPFPDEAQIDSTDNDDIKKLDQFENADQIKKLNSIHVGTFVEIENDNTCVIYDRTSSERKKIPNQGYLYYSVVGDSVRLMRRENARNSILARECPIKDLALIVDKGVSVEKTNIHEQPITNMLTRKFPDKVFNEKQRDAIEAAINTPDIALILGPPGTGKTTVIKAIIARFEEYFKKHNDNQIPRILVSSFQHEAVENVIVGVDGNGIPSERKGGKRDEENKQTLNIREWRNNVTIKLGEKIDELTEGIDYSKETLRDKVYAWEKKGKEPAAGIELLKDELQDNRLKLSSELIADITELLSRTSYTSASQKVSQEWEEEKDEENSAILNAQRLTTSSYADDGKRQIINLKVAIFNGNIHCSDGTEFIDAVLNSKGKDEEVFNKYVKIVEKLKQQYVKQKTVATSIDSLTSIEQCLKRMDEELNQERLQRLENRDEATAYILQNYLELIQDEHEIQSIIDKYSNITAATCQQAMEVGRFASSHLYDLVIVDEAARANPLDLLIPMSMAKKIILVGDFLQLPHMLDPEVTKQFENDEKLESLNVLKKSLFQRMYESFDNKPAKVTRTVQLTKQFRMNSLIGDFVNREIYQKENYLLDSSDVDDTKKQANLGMFHDKPLVWIDADKNHFGLEEGRRSKYRPQEAKLLVDEVKSVLKIDMNKTVGVISFYKKQTEYLVKLIKQELTETQQLQVEVGTVDAFQGKEFDVVFLSCTRANTIDIENQRQRTGHLQDRSRLCVSLTRARQLLVAVGDRDTVECVPIIGSLIQECEKGGGYYEQA